MENNTKTGHFCQITDKMLATYTSKNEDYGNAFVEELTKSGWGYATGLLGSKVSRIRHLLLHAPTHTPKQGESLEDNLLDLANYAILTLMAYQERKENANNVKAEDYEQEQVAE